MAGRPTKYTPRTVDRILATLKDGNFRDVACRVSGIGGSTFYEWLEQYPEFADAVEKAEAEAEQMLVDTVKQASYETWTAAAWMLERKYKTKWARVEVREHSGPNGGPIAIKGQFDFAAFGGLFGDLASGGTDPADSPNEPLDTAHTDAETGRVPGITSS